VAAVCAALVARAATGEGVYLDVSVADGVLALMALAIDEHLAEGVQPGPREGLLTGRYAWYDLYQAADGGWLAVAAIEAKFFANLCRILGCEQWIDRQYDDDVETMRADFTAAFASRNRDDWVAELAPADACVSPVLDVPGVVADGQYGARGAFVEVAHPTSGRLRQVGAPLARQVDPVVLEIPDWTATATEELLDEVGVAPDTVTAWRAEGVIA
jgi:alpha-methylacyl-CoA racemase